MPFRTFLRRRWIFAVIVLGALVPTVGFGQGIYFYDSAIDVHIDPAAFLMRLCYAWTPDYFLGMHAGFMQGYLSTYTVFYALLAVLHVPALAAQRIVMFGIYLSIILSTYLSLKYIAPRMHYVGRLVAALGACWNIYVAFNSHGSSVMLLPYAAMPAFVAVYAAYVDAKIRLLPASAAIALLSLFATGINPPLLAIDAAVIVFFCAAALVASKHRLKTARALLALSACSLVTIVLTNLYWLVPFLDYFHSVWLGGVLSESASMHNAETSFTNTLRGFGQWAITAGDDSGPYYAWAASYLGITVFSVATWVQVALAFCGLAYRRNAGRGQAFFLLCIAAGLPLVVGYYTGPIGKAVTYPIYAFLFTKVPYFQMFRSVYKWEGVVVWAMASLLGAFVSGLLTQERQAFQPFYKKWRNVGLAAASIALVFSFYPVVANGMNPPEAFHLPDWVSASVKSLPATTQERAALLPGQYLEQFLWGSPSYYLESALAQRPLFYGYLGSAPSEDSDQWLLRAFREARAGDPDARDVFRLLGAQYVLQRDDFRSYQDFAFPSEDILTTASEAHDIATRVLSARPLSVNGASRIYGLPSVLTTIHGAPVGLIADLPGDEVAASFDASILAKGLTTIDARHLRFADLSALAGAGALIDKRPVPLKMLATTSLEDRFPHAYSRSGDPVAIVVERRGQYHLFIDVVGLTDREAVLATFDKLPVECSSSGAGWRDCGDVQAAAGSHSLVIKNKASLGLHVAMIPDSALQSRIDELRSLGKQNRTVAYVDQTMRHVYDVKAPSKAYKSSTSSYAWSSEISQAVPLSRPVFSKSFTQAAPVRSEGTAMLPVLPFDGVASTDELWLPRRFYADARTYQWNRGVPQRWYALQGTSRYYILNPNRSDTHAVLKMPLSIVSSGATVRIKLNQRTVIELRMAGRGDSMKMIRPAGFASVLSEPEVMNAPITLAPGSNNLEIAIDGSSVPMSTFTDAGGARALHAVAAMPSAPSVTVTNASAATRMALPRGVRSAFLSLPSLRLWGDPHLRGTITDQTARTFLAFETQTGRGKVAFALRELETQPNQFDVSLADMLPNSFSDAHLRIIGVWIFVVGDARADKTLSPVLDMQYTSAFRRYAQKAELDLSSASVASATKHVQITRGSRAIKLSFRAGTSAVATDLLYRSATLVDDGLQMLQIRAHGGGLGARAHVQFLKNGRWLLLGTSIPVAAMPSSNLCAGRDLIDVNSFDFDVRDVTDGSVNVERRGTPLRLQAGCGTARDGLGLVADAKTNHVGALVVPPHSTGLTIVDGTGVHSALPSGLLTVPTTRLKAKSAIRITFTFDRQQDVRSARSFTIDPPLVLSSGDELSAERTEPGERTLLAGMTVVPLSRLGQITGLDVRRASPVRFSVVARQDINKPFLLVFGESYHPMWNASLNDVRLLHLEANGYANAWLVPSMKRGEEVKGSFAGQRRFAIASAISILTLAIMIVLALTLDRRRATER